jgi:hypothetical protein
VSATNTQVHLWRLIDHEINACLFIVIFRWNNYNSLTGSFPDIVTSRVFSFTLRMIFLQKGKDTSFIPPRERERAAEAFQSADRKIPGWVNTDPAFALSVI